MEEEITLEHKGIECTATYLVQGDTLTVFLPNGEQRITELRGIDPIAAARPHLRAYINGLAEKIAEVKHVKLQH